MKATLLLAVTFLPHICSAGTGVGHWTPGHCTPGAVVGYDSAVWDDVSVEVSPDAEPGLYSVVGRVVFSGGFNNIGIIYIAVEGDRTFSWGFDGDVPPSVDFVYYATGARIEWIPQGPNGGADDSSITVNAEAMRYGGEVCGGSAQYIHGRMSISIADGHYVKKCDRMACAGNCGGVPMAGYGIHAMAASLHVEDTPFRYRPGRGPAIDFTVTYNHHGTQLPANCPNLGPNWSCNWVAFVTDNPDDPAIAKVHLRDGGREIHSGYNNGTQTYAPEPQNHVVLAKVSTDPDPIKYERRFPDGSKEVYGHIDTPAGNSRRIYMTEVWDVAGNKATIDFANSTSLKIDSITDSLGYKTTFAYGSAPDPLRIRAVHEPMQFGGERSASFDYYANGRLHIITDEIGIQSTFGYASGSDFINLIETPYGPTTFTKEGRMEAIRWIEVVDPRLGRERVEFNRDHVIDGSEPVPAGFTAASLDGNNTFYWDKKYNEDYPNSYDRTKARIIHWALNPNDKISGIVASEKQPLENRVWYAYQGQSDSNHVGTSANPTKVARVLDDNSTQLWEYAYNSIGKIKKIVDPATPHRVTTFEYEGNDIDLRNVYQQRSNGASTDPSGAQADRIASYEYDIPDHPHLVKIARDAANQPTTYEYFPDGQVHTITNAKGEITTYKYGNGSDGPLGYLISIKSPGNQAETVFGYDGAKRLHVITRNPDEYQITLDRDELDRVTLITYPDGTTQEFLYTDDERGMTLDLTASKDRRGLWTSRHYNKNRQLDSITDPLGRTTLYDWCTCGSLVGISDPDSKLTAFDRDLQSRIKRKIFNDATEINYTYEDTTSRLKLVTDGLNQTTTYEYWPDGNLKNVTYANAVHATPNVHFCFDQNYNRVESMNDGTGLTTYSYNTVTASPPLGAGQLQTVNSPLLNDVITYGYDQLGRQLSQDIDGTPASVTYDSLGRIETTTNALGPFERAYDGPTPRLLTLNYPNGQTANFTYFTDNEHDRRLQTLQHLTAASVNLSRHDYTYDSEGQIQTWNRTLGQDESDFVFTYDDADQLLGAAQGNQNHVYDYDLAGNRLTDAVYSNGHPARSAIYTANKVNELDSVSVQIGSGTPSIPVPLIYDANGNMTYDGANQTFEWDGANRLIAINYIDSGNRTEFAYDGLGRRVRITEYGPAVTAIVRPRGEEFSIFSTSSFNLLTGGYALKFEGLNPNGGVNTAFIDAVMLNNTLIANGSFENPQLNEDEIAPVGDANWTYAGNAGIAIAGGELLSAFQQPPDGQQAAFVTNQGSISQIGFVAPGDYELSFQAAQRESQNESYQQVRVALRGAFSNKTFLWSGNTIMEERDATGGNVTKRFFVEGEQRIDDGVPLNYYYSRDHLGSIREVTDENGELKGQYEYDAWGNATTIVGKVTVDFGFTGHYFHQASGMNLSLYRAYSPTLGRWLSRDPVGEGAELNLYEYVRNAPINLKDSLGLWPWDPSTEDGSYNCMAYAICGSSKLPWKAPRGNDGPNVIPPRFGCKLVDCCNSCDKCSHKIIVYEDSGNVRNWHVYKQDRGGGFSCKYGEAGIGYGSNPDQDYRDMYPPKGRVIKTCWCCPN
jgi:RHS repeat-associated protein